MATWTDITNRCSGLTTSCPAENFTEKKGYLSLVVTQVEQSDSATNKTRVTWELRICGTPWVQLNGRYATIGEETVVAKNTSQVNSWSKNQVLNSGSVEFDNNDDGTISLPTYVKQLFYYGYSDARWSSKTQEASGQIVVPQLPRKSIPTVSPSTITLGSSGTITTNRQSSSFTHTIKIWLGSTCIETFNNVSASMTWTPSIATYAPYITGGTTKHFTIECLTYSGNDLIGSEQISVVLSVPASVKPTASIALTRVNNSVPSAWGVYVQGKSQVSVAITGTKAYNSNIQSYSSVTEGTTYSSSSYTSNILGTSGTRTVTATVTDARGRTSDQASTTFSVVAYSKPSVSNATCERCNSSGVASDNGTYVKWSFTGGISPVSNNNSKTFKVQYRQKGSTGSWSTLYTNTSSYSISLSNQISGNILSASVSYDFKFIAQDYFESTVVDRTISTGFDLIHFNVNGNAIAFGKKSEATGTNKLFEVGMPANFTSWPKVNSKSIIDIIYPVGAIYISARNLNPGVFLGGTWTQLSSRFLYASAGQQATSGEGSVTGGNSNKSDITGTATQGNTGNTGSTTLTAAQSGVPAHSHGLNNHTHSFSANFYIRHGNTNGTEIVAAGTNTTITKAAYSETWGNGFYVSSYSHKPDRVNISGTSGGNSGSTANNSAANASSGHTHTLNGHAHNIPYIAVFVWQRTA